MKQSHNNYYALEDGTIVFFNCEKLKSAILAKKKALEKTGLKCSKQIILERIAEDASISLSAIKHWCAGRHAPSDLDKIRDVAFALDVNVSYLLEKVHNNEKDGYSMDFATFERNSLEEIWVEVLNTLSKRLAPAVIAIWLADCKPILLTDRRFVLCTTDDLNRDIVEFRYSKKMQVALADLLSWKGDVAVIVG